MKLVLILFILLIAIRSEAGVREVKDSETGVTVQYVTNEPCANTISYPTCRTWSRDGKYLFVESNRPRKDGTQKPVERQLLKINVKSGETTYLATLEVEDTKAYGPAHMRTSTQYHFDYAQDANMLVYYDMTGHNLYLLDPDTGKTNRILHEPEGTIGDPPAITPDGKRVVYYVLFPSIENRFLSSVTSVVFALDIDPEKLEPIGEPKIVTAYPGRMVEEIKDRYPKGVITNHCQVNPKDPDHYCYAHEFGGIKPDSSTVFCRLWENRNGIDRLLDRPEPGRFQTHEVIGPLGKSLYFVDSWGISAVDFETYKKREIYRNTERLNPCHITISPDEKWIAADMWDSNQADENGCYKSGIVLIEVATGKSKVLCRILRGSGHPRHPHPNFSSDGKKIAFVVADGKDNCQVAYVDVSEIVGTK